MEKIKIENQLEEANDIFGELLSVLGKINSRIEDYRERYKVSTEDAPDLIPASLLEGES